MCLRMVGQQTSFDTQRLYIEVKWGQEPDLVLGRSRLRIIIIGLDNCKSWEENELHLRALVVKEGNHGVLYRIGKFAFRGKE
jgi:hypothetical protein